MNNILHIVSIYIVAYFRFSMCFGYFAFYFPIPPPADENHGSRLAAHRVMGGLDRAMGLFTNGNLPKYATENGYEKESISPGRFIEIFPDGRPENGKDRDENAKSFPLANRRPFYTPLRSRLHAGGYYRGMVYVFCPAIHRR